MFMTQQAYLHAVLGLTVGPFGVLREAATRCLQLSSTFAKLTLRAGGRLPYTVRGPHVFSFRATQTMGGRSRTDSQLGFTQFSLLSVMSSASTYGSSHLGSAVTDILTAHNSRLSR